VPALIVPALIVPALAGAGCAGSSPLTVRDRFAAGSSGGAR
jgi:hypothetical protein